MQFCDDCGSMMKPEDGAMVCSNCGTVAEQDEASAEKYVSTEEQTDTEIVETSEQANFEGNPTASDVRCDECGHGEAWYTIQQTASADEPPTRFFKCKECGHKWRGYS